MEGKELAIRFSYIVNELCYCGPKDAHKSFEQYLKDKSNNTEITLSFKKFEGLIPYLSSISKKHKKELFDYDVVEAYWIGNKLLDSFEKKDMQQIVTHLSQRGLPPSLSKPLIENMPEGYFPHHNFNVFYVGVGNTSGKVPTTINTMENCRISWGKVKEVLEDKLVVNKQPLIEENNILKLGSNTNITVDYLPLMITPKKGDVVALHWNFAAMILTKEQQENLKKYTHKILDLRNLDWK